MGVGCGGSQQGLSVGEEVHRLWHRDFEGVSVRQSGEKVPFFGEPKDLVMVCGKEREREMGQLAYKLLRLWHVHGGRKT